MNEYVVPFSILGYLQNRGEIGGEGEDGEEKGCPCCDSRCRPEVCTLLFC